MTSSVKHVVKSGETLIKIARTYEIKDWKKLWSHKENQALNKKHGGDETAIQPKDVLVIPADLLPAAKIELVVGGKTYTFKSEREKADFLKTIRVVELKGKKLVFVGSEWDQFQQSMISELRRTAVLAAKTRAASAAALHQHFRSLNDEQYIVSWFVSLTGPKLPDQGLVNSAVSAAQALEAAVNSGDFAKIQNALRAAEGPVNQAHEAMWNYQKSVIGSAEGWVAGLEFTKTTSFAIVGACAAPAAATALGSAALAGAVIGGGTALVSSSSNELGKAIAGTSKGGADAAKNIALETLIGGTIGAVLKSDKGTKIIEGAGKALAEKITGQWLGRISGATAQKYIVAYLNNAGQAALEQAVKEAGTMITGKTKPQDFFGNVAKSAVLGGVLKNLDKAVDTRYAQAVFDKLPPASRDAFFKGLKEPVKHIADLLKEGASTAASTALDATLAAAKGNEDPKGLVDTAAGRLVKDRAFLDKLQAAAAAK